MRYDDEHLQVKTLNRKSIDQIVEFLEEVKELELDEDEIQEIKDILIEGYSFGVYSNNTLYGISMMYECSFDGIQVLFDNEPNALSAEPHIDYSFEDTELLERVMFRAMDRMALDNNFDFIVIQLAKTVKEIRDSPSELIRAIIVNGYRFIESPDDVTIAYKDLGESQ
ncbi:MAG: hypothetical protein NZ908_00285 [Candidatus Micrarchaeota archaeon]|nr:hypothetical protein [Candidatus Micrarchaeota archaeon]MCX8154650.1 hypothetical protein [Candidatus Micrarchaeota archaeon]